MLRRVIPVAAILTAVSAAWALTATFLAERLIVSVPLDRADAILVVAGSAAYRERTRTAARLYGNAISRKILLTHDGERAGWSKQEQRNPPFFELAKRELTTHGVPDEAIEVFPQKMSGTIMEARVLAKEASERRWKSLLIVTSAHHTRRALWTFERVFAAKRVETTIGIVPAMSPQHAYPVATWWFTGDGWRDVAGEYVKSLYYYLAY
jgi:uncharacterized SAM-binding protein YcdF (DUF218 family)